MLLYMSNRHITAALLLAAALLAQGAAAQTPVRPPQFVVPPSTRENNFLSDLAMDGAGNLTFLWWSLNEEVFTQRFSSADVPLGPVVRLDNPRFRAFGNTVVANQRGDILMIWNRFFESGLTESVLQRTSPVLSTLKLRLRGEADVAVDRDGNFVVVWAGPSPAGR